MVLIVLLIGVFASLKYNNSKVYSLEGVIVDKTKDTITIKSDDNTTYTFKVSLDGYEVGDIILLEYLGILNDLEDVHNNEVINSKVITKHEEKEVATELFKNYEKKAEELLGTMNIEDKIKQMLVVRYDDKEIPGIGGFIFFAKDFKNKDADAVRKMITSLQENAKIPLLTLVDEEGGSVVRISSNPLLRASKYLSPREVYEQGGMDAIKDDTLDKSELLKSLGINVNLAPVVDIATESDAFMYKRSLGYDVETTSEFAKTVIEASKGSGVSYVLKHFPGYGNNDDTHVSEAHDERSYEDIMGNDILPFKEGIEDGAEAILVSHNIVNSIDEDNPSSLSLDIHKILIDELKFKGIIITDDLEMGATKNITDKYIKAVNALNDILIVTDYDEAYKELMRGYQEKDINIDTIDRAVLKILEWKYYKGLINDNDK